MEADLILQALETHLRPKVVAAGGTLDIADNPWDVVDLLKVTPTKWRLIISLEDETAAAELAAGGWTTGTFAFYVQRHRGMQGKAGDTIHKTSMVGARTSHLRLAARVRRWVRAIQFPENDDIAKDFETPFIFTGAEWVDGTETKGEPWRVRRLDFGLVYALDDPAADDDPDGDNTVHIPTAVQISGVSEDGLFYLLTLGGQAVGRVPRFEAEAADPGGDGTGWRLLELADDPLHYVVALGGTAHGRIQRYGVEG